MPNRLAQEKSPYLLQHQNNPVDWYPWGDEAFEKARKENKPIFLSIGYSTCHWCHVFAHESFEDEEVAGLLNTYFVSIKVDREERPDIDSVYMTVCQALTGQGGWPLSIFMTPDQKPFFAGTYFPKESRYGQPGFIDVLKSISTQYQKDKEKLTAAGQEIVKALAGHRAPSAAFNPELVEECIEDFKKSFDPEYGGFGTEPKFPAPHQLLFLLRYAHWKQDSQVLNMVEKTLEGMAEGGIHDHIGGGFARYSVDSEWLVPHFEKMLYDQAMLMIAYSEAYQVTQNPDYQKIVDGIFTYLIREMRDEKGGFYSAEDADSEGVEGKFYVWDPDEVITLLGDQEGERFCIAYDITEEGNFEGKNIPNLIGRDIRRLAEDQGLTLKEFHAELEKNRHILLQARSQRVRPHRDDKILTSWNGLIIAALATAARIFQEEHYLKAAEEAFTFIKETMVSDGRLMARYREGEIKHTGFLDDYAYLLWACDALYEATFDVDYLRVMENLADQTVTYFWDEEGFGFYLNDKTESLVFRPKDLYDGALPSGNSIAALMLFKLARRTGNIDFEMYVDKMLQNLGKEVEHYPMGHSALLTSFLLTHMPTKELVILAAQQDVAKEAAEKCLVDFHPDVFMVAGTTDQLTGVASFTTEFKLLNDKVTYYLCENFSCQRPTNDVDQIKRHL
ncbi:uncharacterized protein YyaL (SSP411 family) [Pullulanibacillus pueri]|uniref:Spermatogenesis-associated protein 20-like TRX domain-containing protein n=1 Tax=Pullulanibacillus pueri TaxID=1437324 RepID=A0A8J2ZUE2_9BACL|nr:thioredoxin domain-containing protein [Pullulanibacillus pueri]MBM7681381.1 uncharacterized protein YyaL (SSP411 family) [Pullulanibacillus pueri]GGH78654.1 hypothetical protein GCM10007096_12410 [Pullulanibacillus pueri]